MVGMTYSRLLSLVLPCSALLLAACGGGHGGSSDVPGDAGDNAAYNGIKADEILTFTGTEPFWGGEVSGTQMTYSTPDNLDPQVLTVSRFAGRGGLSYSGQLDGKDFVMAVTPATCSDGMSDRSYPFTVTLHTDGVERNGCGYTDKQRFTGPENP